MDSHVDYKAQREANMSLWHKVLRVLVWRPRMYINDKIEELKYKLYVKLYCWFDCLPPDNEDL